MRLIPILAALALSAVAFATAQAQTSGTSENRTFSWENGDTFSGEVRNGLPNGPGTFRTGGHTYSGEWKDGCLATADGRRFAIFTTLDKCPPWRRPRLPRPDFK